MTRNGHEVENQNAVRRGKPSQLKPNQLKLGIGVAAFCFALSLPVAAFNMQHAFEHAYEENPSLLAEREKTKGTNESVREAIGNALPTVTARLSLNGDIRYFHRTDNSTYTPSFLASINLNQPLYRSGAIGDGIRFVEFNTKAQWSRLRSLEQGIFNQVAQAYIGICKDAALVRQYKKSIKVLARQLEAAQARFDVGEGTLTEIAQARTRVAQTKASLQTAQSGLNTRRATFTQLVGREPGKVATPTYPKSLPKSKSAAIEAALSFDPQLLANVLSIKAAEVNEELQLAQGRAAADLTASVSENVGDIRDFKATRTKNLSVGATLTVPLFQGGRIKSKYVQAKHSTRQAKFNLDATRASLRQGATAAWNQLSNARAMIKAFKAQEKAAALVLEGASLELEVGTKTFLDVLDAEMTLQEANIGLVRAEFDELAAGYALLAASGRMTARDLNLDVVYWDAEADYQAILATFDAVYKYLPTLKVR